MALTFMSQCLNEGHVLYITLSLLAVLNLKVTVCHRGQHPPTQLPEGLKMDPRIHYVTVLKTKNQICASYCLPMSPIKGLKNKLPVKPTVSH